MLCLQNCFSALSCFSALRHLPPAVIGLRGPPTSCTLRMGWTPTSMSTDDTPQTLPITPNTDGWNFVVGGGIWRNRGAEKCCTTTWNAVALGVSLENWRVWTSRVIQKQFGGQKKTTWISRRICIFSAAISLRLFCHTFGFSANEFWMGQLTNCSYKHSLFARKLVNVV